jgi:hypothetical protein
VPEERRTIIKKNHPAVHHSARLGLDFETFVWGWDKGHSKGVSLFDMILFFRFDKQFFTPTSFIVFKLIDIAMRIND